MLTFHLCQTFTFLLWCCLALPGICQPKILEIACKQLGSSRCPLNFKWKNQCGGGMKSPDNARKEEGYLQEGTRPTTPTGQGNMTPYNSSLSLYKACEKGHLDAVKYILSYNPKAINHRGKWGRTPVMVAAFQGHSDVFDYLVRQGCDLSLRDDNNNGILHCACYGGKTYIVRQLLTELKVNVNGVGGYGWTPLYIAVYSGHRDVVELLVSKRSNVDLVDKFNNNILHLASQMGHADIVEYIVSRNLIRINSRGIYRETAVMMAAEYGHSDIVEFLKNHGSDMLLLDSYGRNILHLSCTQDRVPMVKYIITLNVVNLESRDKIGRTALMSAASSGCQTVLDYLVRKGFNWEVVNYVKNNILHEACLGGHVNMVEHIIKQYKFSIESKGFCGRTPLLTSAGTGFIRVFELIVREKGNLEAVDVQKSNILHVACVGGHLQMVNHIIMKYQVNIESKGYLGRTPLLIAASSGKIDIFDFLVSKGSNLKAVDDDEANVFHLACLGHINLAKHLLKKYKADIESKGGKERTPLLIVVGKGYIDSMKFLRSEGCNMKAVDTDNNNIMHMACASGNADLVRYLIRLQVVPMNARNKHGYTPLQVAVQHGHGEIINLLKAEQ